MKSRKSLRRLQSQMMVGRDPSMTGTRFVHSTNKCWCESYVRQHPMQTARAPCSRLRRGDRRGTSLRFRALQ